MPPIERSLKEKAARYDAIRQRNIEASTKQYHLYALCRKWMQENQPRVFAELRKMAGYPK